MFSHDGKRPLTILLAAVLAWPLSMTAADTPSEPATYYGMSDASAAVPVDADRILVADDETNSLRLYRVGGGQPPATYDLAATLAVDEDHPEADIEGATRVGSRVYWITSHGRNKDGKDRPSRHRFFAVQIDGDGALALRPVGRPFTGLALALAREPALRGLGLEDAVGLEGGARDRARRRNLAPKQDGLNIEALAASPDGQVLYIGLRNPRPRGPDGRPRAVVVPLLNAAAVVERGAAPQFGPPLLWDLEGLGLRSLEYSEAHGAFLALAGPHDDGAGGSLYRWSGSPAQPPRRLMELEPELDFRPEALLTWPGSPRVLVLSDDGSVEVSVAGPEQCVEGEYLGEGRCLNKHQWPPAGRWFRSVWLEPDAQPLGSGGPAR